MKIFRLSILGAILVALLIPNFAIAVENDGITPVSISFAEKADGVEELSAAKIDEGKVNIDVKLLEINDFIKYKLVLRNDSESDFELNEVSFDADEMVTYDAVLSDGDKTIKAGETKEVTLTITYVNRADDADYENGVLEKNTVATLIFMTSNPATLADFPLVLIAINVGVVVLLYVVYRKNGQIRRIAVIAVALSISLVPLSAYCGTVSTVDINAKITIPKYEGREINNVIMDDPIIDDEHSDYMEPETGVNFLEPSSDTNGKGVYIFAPTKNDDVPIYYYRGAVENNNLIFADFCWKIFRTTESSGLKIVYNGTPTNGQCVSEGADTMVATGIKYNPSNSNLSYFGYSHAGSGHTFIYKRDANVASGTIFANDVSYVDGKYVLSDDRYVSDSNFSTERDEKLRGHHYTCYKSNVDACETVSFVYMTRSVNAFYINLKGGEKIEDVIENDITNEATANKSTVRAAVDNWYAQNMTSYTDRLEDVAWCNDRSIYSLGGWSKDGGVAEAEGKLTFNANHRVFVTGKPDINCVSKNDSFTVSEENGNGSLEYPVGLLTLDEVVMSGFNWYEYNASSDNYLNNGLGWWTMSPSLQSANFVYVGVAYSRADHVYPTYVSNGLGGVRPVVSLKKGYKIQSGDGTSANPFTLSDI